MNRNDFQRQGQIFEQIEAIQTQISQGLSPHTDQKEMLLLNMNALGNNINTLKQCVNQSQKNLSQ
jgi:hypothetical protein